ncbi:MAG: cysteine hydrolase [Erysipelotrichaceae bacterium]|nr:cysteine hydrolase [Erysipelotrichaceae bacterium]MDY5251268.1 isochorismatase family cysteine hydrolase [Erysipelotrichaceae bacterium]
MKTKKIVIVDMVNGFVKEGALHDPRIMDITENIKSLLAHKQDHGIIVLEDCHEEGCAEFNSFPPHCIKGTSEAKTIDELQYVFDLENFEACVQKNSTNGFFAMKEADLLTADEYILVGCCTDICVAQLAMTLKVYGNDANEPKKVIVVKDGVATYDAFNHAAAEYDEAAFKLMGIAGVEVKSLAEILED